MLDKLQETVHIYGRKFLQGGKVKVKAKNKGLIYADIYMLERYFVYS